MLLLGIITSFEKDNIQKDLSPLIGGERKKFNTIGAKTMLIGISGCSIKDLNFSVTPFRNPKVISGAAFGAGKLNEVWKSAVLIKKRSL